jgi:DNA end-binding protein Ku
MICPLENEVVEREDQTKGYEFQKGQFVTFSPEELKTLEEQGSEVIEIVEFVPTTEVDPVYFDKSYFLGPERGGERAYALLREVMKQTGRVAIARYAARGKQYLMMLRPAAGDVGLVMQQLRYADEVKSISEVPLTRTEVKDHELKLAKQLVEQIATPSFEPEKYEDEVKKRTQALIDRKVQGEEITALPTEEPQAKIIDLMEALKASLAGGKPAKEEPAAATPIGERKPARHAPEPAAEAEAPPAAKPEPRARGKKAK